MVDLLVNQLPQLIEFIGRARGVGSGLLASEVITDEERILFKENLTAINIGMDNITNAINIKMTVAPQLRNILKPIMEQADKEASRFVKDSSSLTTNSSIKLKTEHYFYDGTKVITVFQDVYRKIGHLLTTHLEQRLKFQQKLRLYTIVGTSLAAVLILYFIGSFYQADRAAFKKIEQLSVTDSLTQLYNRRYLYRIFPKELQRARRDKKSFAYGILDIDHFKRYNDTYGHPEGDFVLKRVADALNDALRRADDFAFRIGGEEFCFFVTGMNKDEIGYMLEQIQARIAALEIEHKGNEVSPFLTVSIGLAYLDEVESAAIDEIIKRGDEALYKSKDMGRNCYHIEFFN